LFKINNKKKISKSLLKEFEILNFEQDTNQRNMKKKRERKCSLIHPIQTWFTNDRTHIITYNLMSTIDSGRNGVIRIFWRAFGYGQGMTSPWRNQETSKESKEAEAEEETTEEDQHPRFNQLRRTQRKKKSKKKKRKK
jgi:hypothetical protein